MVEPACTDVCSQRDNFGVHLVRSTTPDSERIRVMNRGKYTLDSNPRFLGIEARIPQPRFTMTSSLVNKCIIGAHRLHCARVTDPKRFRAESDCKQITEELRLGLGWNEHSLARYCRQPWPHRNRSSHWKRLCQNKASRRQVRRH